MIAQAFLFGLIFGLVVGFWVGLFKCYDAVRLAVVNDSVTELSERLNTIARGTDLHCPKCRQKMGLKLGEIKRTPV